MSNHEGDRRAAESSRIAGEGGRISAESGRVSADAGRATREENRRLLATRRATGQLFAYIMIIGVGVAGFWQIEREADANHREICSSANENRDALKGMVMAVDALGRSLIADGVPYRKLSIAERKAIKTVKKFRTEQLALLDEPVC